MSQNTETNQVFPAQRQLGRLWSWQGINIFLCDLENKNNRKKMLNKYAMFGVVKHSIKSIRNDLLFRGGPSVFLNKENIRLELLF